MSSPVITLDGPSGTGKGTILSLLADALGWHVLDSGAIYRAVAWVALEYVVDPKDEEALVELIARTEICLLKPHPHSPLRVLCENKDISALIRTEEVGMAASGLSMFPKVRAALVPLQRSFRRSPGLITDGRDMGTVIFPDADLKLYLDADPEVRARRRFTQLRQKGEKVTFEEVQADLLRRDGQDTTRHVAPLKPAEDAHLIDTTHLSAEAVFSAVMVLVREYVL